MFKLSLQFRWLWCVDFPACSFLISSGTFDLLVYTIPDCEVPQEWAETQPCFIANAQEMPFRTFSTSLHRMETHVTYKVEWTEMAAFLLKNLVHSFRSAYGICINSLSIKVFLLFVFTSLGLNPLPSLITVD